MRFAHIEKEDGTIQPVIAWACCPICGGEHLIRPGLEKPYWWCGDDIITLGEGDEVLVEYVDA